jgi:putative Mn2+ efflux pump MntP
VSMQSDVYTTDFYAWTQAQAALFRHQDTQVLDDTNGAAEVESGGISLRQALESPVEPEDTRMKLLHKLFPLGHFLISLLFIGCGVALITFAALQLWRGVQPWHGLALNERLHTVLDSIAVLTVAVAALELGQTILEEEVQREAQMSLPTRVRRFLSRFMIVLVVSLSIEALVAVFQFNRTHPEHLPYAALIGLMAATLLAAWGLFIWLNRSAEELEPHAMAQVQREDEQVP